MSTSFLLLERRLLVASSEALVSTSFLLLERRLLVASSEALVSLASCYY